MSSRSMKEREIRDSRRGSRKSSTDRKRSSSRRPRSSSRGSKCHRSSKSRSHTPNNSSGVKRRCRVPWKSTTEENKQVIKVVKERAKRRQGTLVCLQIMNLVLQLCLSISIFAVVVCLYALENQHSYWFYYLLQSVVLTIVVSIIVCNPNTCFRIILISGHISTVIYSVFIILEQIRRHTFKLDCWDEEDTCFWQWPLKADFEVGYLGLASILLHTLMFILSILMVFYYEGSIDQLKLKDKAHAILESQITNEPSRRKKVKGNKRQMIILEDRSSLRGKVAKRTINAVFVDKEGEPVVYGQTITTSRSIIYDTPKAVQEKGRRQTVLVEANEQRKKVVEMPALESPIAYLTRKRNEANEMKKSSNAI